MDNSLIKRQDAIDAAVEAADEWDGGYSRSREEIITMKLRMLPSADRKGHWIKHGEPPWYVIECSECGAKWQMSGSWDANNFCGNCGARMKGGEDNEND